MLPLLWQSASHKQTGPRCGSHPLWWPFHASSATCQSVRRFWWLLCQLSAHHRRGCAAAVAACCRLWCEEFEMYSVSGGPYLCVSRLCIARWQLTAAHSGIISVCVGCGQTWGSAPGVCPTLALVGRLGGTACLALCSATGEAEWSAGAGSACTLDNVRSSYAAVVIGGGEGNKAGFGFSFSFKPPSRPSQTHWAAMQERCRRWGPGQLPGVYILLGFAHWCTLHIPAH